MSAAKQPILHTCVHICWYKCTYRAVTCFEISDAKPGSGYLWFL